jgi:hypothetical protein
MTDYMTVDQFAAKIGKSPWWVRKNLGWIPHHNLNKNPTAQRRTISFKTEDLEAFDQLTRRTPATPTRRNIGTRKRKTQP